MQDLLLKAMRLGALNARRETVAVAKWSRVRCRARPSSGSYWQHQAFRTPSVLTPPAATFSVIASRPFRVALNVAARKAMLHGPGMRPQ